MSIHLSSNKPRSLHRQLPSTALQQQNNNININNNNNNMCSSNYTSLSSNLEHSLDEWLSRSHSNHSFSSMDDPPCPCCQLPYCDSWKKIRKVVHKLETESRLAAEIGQSLLQKNEAYIMESNQLKDQLQQCQLRKRELESTLDETEQMAQQLNREKDKWMWKYEKSEKILNESVADLENANHKCASLTKDLEQTTAELDKLQQYRFKSRQLDSRQDTLQSKLEDTKQELAIARKNEALLESKYKKLLTRYESLSCTYQDLCKSSQKASLSSQHGNNNNDNNGGYSDNSIQPKPLSSMTTPTAVDIQHATTDEVLTFIKGLISTNNYLNTELLTTSTQMDELRNEMAHLHDKYHIDQHDDTNNNKDHHHRQSKNDIPSAAPLSSPSTVTTAKATAATATAATATVENTKKNTSPRRLRSASLRIPRSKSARDNLKFASVRPLKNATPTPQSTISMPSVVHHHYHYYLQQQQQQQQQQQKEQWHEINQSENQGDANKDHTPMEVYHSGQLMGMVTPFRNDQQACHPNNPHLHTKIGTDSHQSPLLVSSSTSAPLPTSTSLSTATATAADVSSSNTGSSSPLANLCHQATSVLQRLRSTDTRSLNRRLQRAFDIRELSKMSNAILQNIVTDVDTMDARYHYLHDQQKTTSWTFIDDFFPLVRLLQDLLREIGQLSITINDLQVAYVTKVEENEKRVQQEVFDKYHHHDQRQSTQHMGRNNSEFTTITTRSELSTPSLLPSTSSSSSSPFSVSTSTSSSSQHTPISPIQWLSTLFTKESSSSKTPDYLAPVTVASRTNTPTSPYKGGDKHRHRRHPSHQTYSSAMSSSQHFEDDHQQHHAHRLWPSISLIVDELRQSPMTGSSSLDREWYWTCSDASLTLPANTIRQ